LKKGGAALAGGLPWLSLKVTAGEELVEEDVIGEDVAWRMGGRRLRGTRWGGAHRRSSINTNAKMA
jgi:hypothetical protein